MDGGIVLEAANALEGAWPLYCRGFGGSVTGISSATIGATLPFNEHFVSLPERHDAVSATDQQNCPCLARERAVSALGKTAKSSIRAISAAYSMSPELSLAPTMRPGKAEASRAAKAGEKRISSANYRLRCPQIGNAELMSVASPGSGRSLP